ncbi:MAG: glycosyltransferase [Actinobacteria bacterium]|nr:glycosyltransferase [Actinomycetota bacterium]
MTSITAVPLDSRSIDPFHALLSDDEQAQVERSLARTAADLSGRTLWHVNSTAEGGGVAEMLSTLVPYLRGGGIDARWAVIEGTDAFFDITKRIHNLLHGARAERPSAAEMDLYAEVMAHNGEDLADRVGPGDVVVFHDPQTAGLIPLVRAFGARVVWQCHVGCDEPNRHTRAAWDLLRPAVRHSERFVLTRPDYLWDGLDADRLRIVPPTIDAFSPKNQELSPETTDSILAAAGLGSDGSSHAPTFERVDGSVGRVRHRVRCHGGHPALRGDAKVATQISRWDRLKDPVGLVRMAADHLRARADVDLILAGPEIGTVTDDPESAGVYADCCTAWDALEPSLRERVHLVQVPMADDDENSAIVNALQRRSDVVIQKSLVEGFGLTVAEAMWKRRPVVASAVGGIQDQIEHGRSGLVVEDPHDLAGVATAVLSLLDDPTAAEQLGTEARERVRTYFLAPRQLQQWCELASELAPAASAA